MIHCEKQTNNKKKERKKGILRERGEIHKIFGNESKEINV